MPNEMKKRLATILDIKAWKLETQQGDINTLKKEEIMRK